MPYRSTYVTCEKCTRSIGSSRFKCHFRVCGKVKVPKPRGRQPGFTAWNKGLTKETSPLVKAHSDKLTGQSWARRPLSEDHKRKLSRYGGYKSGRGHRGWYKGIWCGSSWELAWVLFHLDQHTEFSRCEESFSYQWEGVSRFYTPDFKVGELWVEIKGWESPKWKAKLEAFPYPDRLIVLNSEGMQYILSEIKARYGKDFISLYDSRENTKSDLV